MLNNVLAYSLQVRWAPREHVLIFPMKAEEGFFKICREYLGDPYDHVWEVFLQHHLLEIFLGPHIRDMVGSGGGYIPLLFSTTQLVHLPLPWALPMSIK